jgi:hypothetical protein
MDVERNPKPPKTAAGIRFWTYVDTGGQLLEETTNQEAAGSNPAGRTTENPVATGFSLFVGGGGSGGLVMDWP